MLLKSVTILPGGIRTESSNYTATAADHAIFMDATSNIVIITLPSNPSHEQIYHIKCIDDTFTCSITGNGNNIDGSAIDLTLTLNQAYSLQYDLTFGWAVI